MADLSAIENAMVGVIANSLGLVGYQAGATAQSIGAGVFVRIYRGWPVKAELDIDLGAGNATITVFPEANVTRNVTRHQLDWQQASANVPTLTGAASGNVVTFGGAGGLGQVAGVTYGTGVTPATASYRLIGGDTPSTVAAALGALIPGSSVAGAVLTCPGPASVTIVCDQTAALETRRQSQGICVTCWCPDPRMRDVIGSFVDGGFANLLDVNGNLTRFLALPDGTSAGPIVYRSNHTDDVPQQANLWRRDLRYIVEYGSDLLQTQPEMIFGGGYATGDVMGSTQHNFGRQ